MRTKGKRLIGYLLSLILLLSSVTTYADDGSGQLEPQSVATYVLSVEVSGTGTVNVSGSGVTETVTSTYSVEAGTEVSIAATPGDGYELAGISLDGAEVSDNFVMPEKNAVLKVKFSELDVQNEESNVAESETDGNTESQETVSMQPEPTQQEKAPIDEQVAKRFELAEKLGVLDYVGEDGYLTDDYVLGHTDYELSQSGVAPLVRTLSEEQLAAKKSGISLFSVTSFEKVKYHTTTVGIFSVDGTMAFCAEHQVSTPLAGAPTSSPVEVTNNTIRQVLYYGYNGPGAWAGFWNREQAIVATSLALSYYYSGPGTIGMLPHGSGATAIGLSDFLYLIEGNPSVPDAFKVYKVETNGGSTQDLMYWEYAPTGHLNLKKTSANPELTNNNSCYSLEGAVYGVYSNSGCTTEVATLTTDAAGNSNTVELNAGTYYVKEKTAPKGYALDTRVYTVTVTSGQTYTLNVTDLPQSDPIAVWLGKIDAETTQNMPQGSASLEGAEFTVKYYDVLSDTDPAESGKQPIRTWVFATDSDGYLYYSEKYKVSGDDFYYQSNGDVTLPLGTVTIKETKAPEGYLLNDEVFVRKITSEGTAENVDTYNEPVVEEEVIRGHIQILKYGQDKDDPDKDIVLPNVTFTMTSKTTGDVYEITTDKNGYASTQQIGGLVFDTYTVSEKNPPAGYERVDDFEVTISNEGETLYYILKDNLIMSPIKLVKTDAETGKVIPIAGTTFQLLDANKNPVMLEVRYPTVTETDRFTTDETGSLTLPEMLQAGVYYFRELSAPEGYLLNGNDIQFEVKDSSDWENPIVVTCPDKPVKGKIRITKTDAETGKPIPSGAEFEVTAAEDITTPDGTVRAVKGEVVTTVTTGSDGTVETDELFLGKYIAKEIKAPEGYLLNKQEFEVSLTYEDQETEIVYGDVTVSDELAKGKIRILKTDAETDKPIPTGAEFEVTAAEDITTPDGTVRAVKGEVVTTVTTGSDGTVETDELFLGKYIAKETKAPEGYQLNEQEFEVSLTYEDQETEIVYADVTVEDSPVMGQIEIIKTDEYTGDVLADAMFEITATEDIKTSDGTVRVKAGTVVDTVTTDSFGRARSIMLYLGKYAVKEIKQPDGYVLPEEGTTWEVELTYKDQVTAIVTEVLPVENRPTVVIIDKKVTGSEQRLSGVKFAIWNKATEDEIDPGMTYKDIYKTDREGQIRLEGIKAGTYCVREVAGVPGYAIDDTIHEFTVTEDGRIDGLEEYVLTIENEKTEITETNVINVKTDTQSAYPWKDVTIVDTVSMVNLQPDAEYVLKGVLADQLTGLPLHQDNDLTGDMLAAEQEFTATEKSMDVDVTFNVDLSAFAGRKTVVYEYLYQDGVLISEHADPNDVRQQLEIRNPSLHTTAIDVESGTHEAIAKDNITIRDNVDHFDIIPGLTYTLKGILMDSETKEPLLIDGKEITVEKEIQIDDADGTISMDFILDASELNNRSTVIFEYLYFEDELVASHEDINDKDQTITFKVGSLSVNMPGNSGHGLVKTGDDTGSTIIGLLLTLAGATVVLMSVVKMRRKGDRKHEE